MFEEYDDLLSASEACELLKVSRNIIYELLNGKKLKGYRCGRNWRIPKLAVEEYILMFKSY